MKRKGRHPERVLSAVRVRQLSKPGRYADGNGLYLVVDQSGARRWILRTVVHGRRRDIGLGSALLVPLADARGKAAELRRIAREDGDPLVRLRKSNVVPNFREAAERVHTESKPSWKNIKHAAQWLATLEHYAFPLIGLLPVNCIGRPDILRVLTPIWLTKPETARRVLQRLKSVFDWAVVAGYLEGDNPVLGVKTGLPRQSASVTHFAALSYDQAPAFITKLRNSSLEPIARLAFEFLILTARRSGEVRGARWSEFDLAQQLWTVTGERMKGGKPHTVPLSDRCTEILQEAKAAHPGGELVFPRKNGAPYSDMVFTMALRRMGMPITAHGFRSTFRDWAAEETPFPNFVVEKALAHTIKDRVASYRRGELLAKRRDLMVAWSQFCAETRRAA